MPSYLKGELPAQKNLALSPPFAATGRRQAVQATRITCQHTASAHCRLLPCQFLLVLSCGPS